MNQASQTASGMGHGRLRAKHGIRPAIGTSLALCLTMLATGVALAADPFLRHTATVEVVNEVGPAVVNITTEHVVTYQSPFRRPHADPFFERFFRDFYEPRRAQTVQNLGSGVIISAEGHVLTNEHVVARADRIRVVLGDGREFDATVVGADPTNDLAVLRVKTDEALPWIAPGDSSDLMVGEPVIAIGNPFGLSNTVTTGVISAIDRAIRSNEHAFHGFLQTDASINPGNSGGPLLNAEGSLIGVNTAIYDGAQGIGFAIPINVARRVVAELIEHGEVLPVTLGIDFQDLDPALREVIELPDGLFGVLINRVQANSPADEGGGRRGDVVIKIDGRKLKSARQLIEILEGVTPDQELELVIWRNSVTQEFSVVAQEIPDNVAQELASRILGVHLEEKSGGGFMVVNVRRGSPAARIPFKRNDLFLGINGIGLSDEPTLRRALLNLRGRDRALVVVQRGPGRYHVTVPLR